MRRALPAIALSAAGLTWLLHAQGVIDDHPATSHASGRSLSSAAARGEPPTSTSPKATVPAPATGHTTDGPAADTRWGPVQVEVVIAGHRIVDVRALAYPDERDRSVAINSDALPQLHDEVISAQSAKIDTVSGATYTSDGYARSLQAALDSAGFKS